MVDSVVHDIQELITLFNTCFQTTHNTRLVKGDDEPIYLPAEGSRPYHAIFFAHGYFSSALHECAHWLIAGEARRTLVDFGYWYAPDGRTAAQQAQFQCVEVKPQAIEWILSVASKHRFRVSIDNLNGEKSNTDAFKLAIHEQIKIHCEHGLSKRTTCFQEALCAFYGTNPRLTIDDFDINMI